MMGGDFGTTLETLTYPPNEHPPPKLTPAAPPELSFRWDSRRHRDPTVPSRGDARCPPGVAGASPEGAAASPPGAEAEREEEERV